MFRYNFHITDLSLTLYSAFWAKALITPKPSLQAHHKNIELQVDPQVMVCNLLNETFRKR